MKPFSFIYERLIRWSSHHYANYYLGAISFIESIFFPIPVDVMLVPMALAKRNQWVTLALIATVFSVLGGILGYIVGHGLFDIIKPWLIDSSYWNYHEDSKRWFDIYGVWVIFVAGFSPIPYKFFTITAGVLTLNLPIFIIASIISRAARFFLVTGIIYVYGKKFDQFIVKYIERIGWILVLTFLVIFMRFLF